MMYSLLSLSLFLIGSYGQVPPVTTAGAAAQPVASQAPVTTSSAPVTTEPPLTPPNNPNVVTPVPPTNPNPNPINPVTPQQPPATPQYGYPQQQYNPYGQGFMPGMGAGLLDPQTLKCEFGQCRNRRITMTPGQGFKLECNMMRQCDGLDLTLNIGVDPTSFGSQVNEINDFNFDAPQSGVKITINNVMMQNIEVNNINCKVMGACHNMQILAGYGVELWEVNVKCEMPGACTGCTINGQSCDMISMMTGNNGGGIAYGYGYMNQPNVPQQPQQPGVGAPAPQGQGMPQQGVPQYPQYQQPQFYPMYNPWI